jgi:hypothetical protein
VDFLSPQGLLRELSLDIPPHARRTLSVNQLVGDGREVSISITSDRPVAAERPVYFNYRGEWEGGHVEGPVR